MDLYTKLERENKNENPSCYPSIVAGNGAAKIVKDLVDYQITHGNLVTVVSLSIMSPSYERI